MRIASLIEKQDKPFYSLEFFPPRNKEDWPNFFNVVEKLKVIDPLFTSVTCGAGGSTQAYTVEIASHIKNNLGLECMAHCTCVRSSNETMHQFFQDLQNAGIDNILALRGDKPLDENGQVDESLIGTDFRYAEDLVRFSREHYPHFGVGVTAYPAPHPESKSFREDRRYLVQKLRAGADFAMTQLFFDAREYINLVETMKDEGITCPIVPGILPIQSLASIKHTLSLCGANIPGKLFLDLEAAHQQGGTEKVKEVGLKYAVEQIRQILDAGAPGIHLYTLNRADLCIQLVDMI